ncbi:hypothetical protein RAA17_18265 [Komagataeibacter rhaeticus]|nr:hypothetical protein [Komagataeibacter rhaeticus]
MPMLDPAQQVVARARLALRRNDPQAETVLATVPDGQQADAALVFDHLRWLHHAQRLDEALALWHARGVAAEKEVPPRSRPVSGASVTGWRVTCCWPTAPPMPCSWPVTAPISVPPTITTHCS